MKISVIIPCYNSEKYIEKCLASVCAQKYKDIEIIVVDDGSTDGSAALCEAAASADSRIRLIKKENGGVVSAYKAALDVASGEYISFVDSDDYIVPDFLAKLIGPILKYGVDISACNVNKFSDSGNIVPEMYPAALMGLTRGTALCEEKKNFFDSRYAGTFHFYRYNKLIRREIILNNIKFTKENISVFEDDIIIIPCLLDAESVYFTDEPLYFYRQHANSIMHKYMRNVIMNDVWVAEQKELIFSDKGFEYNKDLVCAQLGAHALFQILSADIDKKEKLCELKKLGESGLLKDVNLKKAKDFSFKLHTALKAVQKGRYKMLLFVYGLLNGRKRK